VAELVRPTELAKRMGVPRDDVIETVQSTYAEFLEVTAGGRRPA
jgi:hypothetical protein